MRTGSRMLNSFSQFLMSHKKFFLLAQDLKLLGDLSMEIQELVILFGDGVAFRCRSSEEEQNTTIAGLLVNFVFAQSIYFG